MLLPYAQTEFWRQKIGRFTHHTDKRWVSHIWQLFWSKLIFKDSDCFQIQYRETPLQLLAPLGCGLQTGARVIFNTLNLAQGSSVVVFGAGAVGMAAIMAARIRRAQIIIAIDIVQDRLITAQTLGATHTMEFNGSHTTLQIQRLYGGVGPACEIDTTGTITVTEEMIQCLGPKGKGVTIGAPSPGQKVKIDVFDHLTLGKQYIGCNQGDSVP